jgi:hypothetical protein
MGISRSNQMDLEVLPKKGSVAVTAVLLVLYYKNVPLLRTLPIFSVLLNRWLNFY